jgi:hypothetical protein
VTWVTDWRFFRAWPMVARSGRGQRPSDGQQSLLGPVDLAAARRTLLVLLQGRGGRLRFSMSVHPRYSVREVLG